MSPDSQSKILIIGAGISGPALSIFLHQKGYTPILFEKGLAQEVSTAGGAIGLSINGMKVLDLLGDAVGPRIRQRFPRLHESSFYTSEGEILVDTTVATKMYAEMYGEQGGSFGILRQDLNELLNQRRAEVGVEDVRYGKRLIGIEQDEEKVTAIFEDGSREEGAVLVGCDGLKSMVRKVLLSDDEERAKDDNPDFIGICVVIGIAPRPAFLNKTNGFRVYYGLKYTVVVYAVNGTECMWVIYEPSTEPTRESWRAINSPKELERLKQEYKAKFQESWDGPNMKDLISGTKKMIRIGQYDRPALAREKWWKGRSVLLGDAAHPMTSSIAQGANQSLEDCYHLSNLLPSIKDTTRKKFLSQGELDDVFAKYASLREPRTSALTSTARFLTQQRCLADPEACKRRNDFFKQNFTDPEAYVKRLEFNSRPSF